MDGNKKVGITAEFVAIIKSKEDKNYSFFVSPRARRLFNIFNFLFKKTLAKTFDSRLELSNCFNKIISFESPKNIINLGAGFSLEGLRSRGVNYYDFDFPQVIALKKDVLKRICKTSGQKIPNKYHLIGGDLLREYSVKKRGKSVFFAEGVASYLNQEEFDCFILNVYRNMKKGDIFIYNEKWSKKNLVSYGLLRGLMSFLSRSRAYSHFKSEEGAEKYFLNVGFSHVTFLEKGGFNLIKLTK